MSSSYSASAATLSGLWFSPDCSSSRIRQWWRVGQVLEDLPDRLGILPRQGKHHRLVGP